MQVDGRDLLIERSSKIYVGRTHSKTTAPAPVPNVLATAIGGTLW